MGLPNHLLNSFEHDIYEARPGRNTSQDTVGSHEYLLDLSHSSLIMSAAFSPTMTVGA